MTVEVKKQKKNSPAKEIWRRFVKNKPAVFGCILLITMVLLAVFADVIVDSSISTKIDGAAACHPPSIEHIFGTDHLGRDIFARILHGARYSLSVGFVVAFCTTLIGCLIGGIVGYYGGRVDSIIMRVLDVINCVPAMLLSLAIIAALGPSMRNLMFALIIGMMPSTVRLVRSTVISVSDMEYIQSAKIYGSSNLRIICHHVLPNAIGPVIISAAGMVSGTILSAAGMSFLGFGVQPPTPEWGVMLSDARNYMRGSPYMMIFPGVAIVLAAMSINLIGDGLRDALDPKLRD